MTPYDNTFDRGAEPRMPRGVARVSLGAGAFRVRKRTDEPIWPAAAFVEGSLLWPPAR